MKTVEEYLSEATDYSIAELKERHTSPILQPNDCLKAMQNYYNKALEDTIVSQQRELLYGFITWYNAKPKVQKGEHVYTTDVDEFLKP